MAPSILFGRYIMELTVYDRMTLLSILPKQGDFTTLRLVRKLQEALSFDEEEHKVLQFQRVYTCQSCGKQGLERTCECGGSGAFKGRMVWLKEADVPKEIPIGEKATDIIADALKSLSQQKKLTEQHLSLYERFVDAP